MSPGGGMAGREFPAYAIALRRARAERRWSRPRLAYELERVIRHEGKEPPERDSLIRMLRAWENGEHRPDSFNRQRLAEVLGPILDETSRLSSRA
jgi:ribosome-binding protein aMBF1 (putative translation factor)